MLTIYFFSDPKLLSNRIYEQRENKVDLNVMKVWASKYSFQSIDPQFHAYFPPKCWRIIQHPFMFTHILARPKKKVDYAESISNKCLKAYWLNMMMENRTNEIFTVSLDFSSKCTKKKKRRKKRWAEKYIDIFECEMKMEIVCVNFCSPNTWISKIKHANQAHINLLSICWFWRYVSCQLS